MKNVTKMIKNNFLRKSSKYNQSSLEQIFLFVLEMTGQDVPFVL